MPMIKKKSKKEKKNDNNNDDGNDNEENFSLIYLRHGFLDFEFEVNAIATKLQNPNGDEKMKI